MRTRHERLTRVCGGCDGVGSLSPRVCVQMVCFCRVRGASRAALSLCANTVFMRAAKVLQQLQCAFMLAVVSGLEARWTPASDGGPARFSKRHRDAAGIDDSRWTNDAEPGLGPSLFPQTVEGWLFACAACIGIYFLWQQQQTQHDAGHRTGGAPTQRDRDAQEAARRAFTQKYGQ